MISRHSRFRIFSSNKCIIEAKKQFDLYQPHQVLHHIEDAHAAVDDFNECASQETNKRAEGWAPSQIVGRAVVFLADVSPNKRASQHRNESDGEKQRYQKA